MFKPSYLLSNLSSLAHSMHLFSPKTLQSPSLYRRVLFFTAPVHLIMRKMLNCTRIGKCAAYTYKHVVHIHLQFDGLWCDDAACNYATNIAWAAFAYELVYSTTVSCSEVFVCRQIAIDWMNLRFLRIPGSWRQTQITNICRKRIKVTCTRTATARVEKVDCIRRGQWIFTFFHFSLLVASILGYFEPTTPKKDKDRQME